MRAVLHHAGGLNALLELATRTVYTRALLIVVFEGDGGDEMREAVRRARAICADAGGRDEGDGPCAALALCAATR
jgi:hypothetical protein